MEQMSAKAFLCQKGWAVGWDLRSRHIWIRRRRS